MLKLGKYRVYEVTESVLDGSTEILTPKESSTVSIERPVLSRVKIEPGLETIYELSVDSDSEVEVSQLESKVQPEQAPQVHCKEIAPPVDPSPTLDQSKVGGSPVVSIIDSLMRLGARKRSKNVLSRINFDAIKLQQVDYLPPRYDRWEYPHGHLEVEIRWGNSHL